MNPSELRMMWMNHYNPERIPLEDAAAFFGSQSVGLSVMDEMNAQTTMDFNPMMSMVGGDLSAAAAAIVQPAALLQPNTNDFYGLAQIGGLHQQLLTQSAAVFQNYSEMMANSNADAMTDASCLDGSLAASGGTANNPYASLDMQQQQQQQEQLQQQQSNMYDQLEDGSYDEDIDGLASKQEIINIDDFVMMTDSNSYDGTEFIANQKELAAQEENELFGGGGGDGGKQEDDNPGARSTDTATPGGTGSGVGGGGVGSGGGGGNGGGAGGHRSQRKTRKIEPVNRPGLVLKTPIAYKGNIDPSVIPIQKDGMAVCERCGAIGVKHTFYTKSRRFCSMACARGELYSLVVTNKMQGGSTAQQQQQQQGGLSSEADNLEESAQEQQNSQQQQQHHHQHQSEPGSIKNSSYRFRITDQSKITQLNGYDETMTNDSTISNSEDTAFGGGASSSDTSAIDTNSSEAAGKAALRLYQDVLPHEELPQIPKFERLPAPCPQMDKIISIRRRVHDPSHSYDWMPRLLDPDFCAAPVTCFPHAPGYEVWDDIGVDMKVEVENTDCDNLEVIQPGQTPYSFWVATILIISGYKALMRYEGFDDDSHDFWVNLCNTEVHSVGWCATRGKPLIPPRSIEKKYKDWKDYLVGRLSGARTLPSSFYNKINDSLQSRFRLGLNLECVDKDRISQVRLATVTKIVGKRLFLRYFDSDDGFWCHEDSPIIHPVGWATTVGHNLAAPQDYLERMLAGREAMIEVHEDDATIELFKMNFTFEEYYLDGRTNSFMEGMKLEAVDPLNLSSICAATVMAVLKFGYMMIRIDSYSPDATGSDWFCYHEKSPSIFPVGFCEANGILLTPPNGYDGSDFTWQAYLRETGSVAAGQHLFHRVIPHHGFEVGMSLECADLMDPRLVCVATIARVVGRLLKVHFDGWTEEYDQWLDCESPDVYPVGWCVLVNHKLEGPPQRQAQQLPKPVAKAKASRKRRKKAPYTPTTTAKASNENAVKSRTIALKTNPQLPKLSIKLELKPEHHNASFYEDQLNDEGEDEFDRDSSSYRSDHSSSTPAPSEAAGRGSTPLPAMQAQQPPQQQHQHKATVKKSASPAPPTVGRKANSYIGNSSVSNSKYIPRLTDSTEQQQSDLMPDSWNVYDVSQFLRVNDCTAHCDTFSRNKIDGKRLLQLNKDEIITLLGMKVGPAIKIYDLIQQLKCKVNPGKSRLHKGNKAFL